MGFPDLNTKRFKRTRIYFNTDTQYANFRGNPLYKATKRHSSQGSSKKRSVCIVFVNQWTADGEKQDFEIRAWSVLWTAMIRRAALFWTSVVVVQEILRTDTGENCSSQGVKEQRRDKNFCGTCEQKMTDGTNATEFKNKEFSVPDWRCEFPWSCGNQG